jgi:hypothetical protein
MIKSDAIWMPRQDRDKLSRINNPDSNDPKAYPNIAIDIWLQFSSFLSSLK